MGDRVPIRPRSGGKSAVLLRAHGVRSLLSADVLRCGYAGVGRSEYGVYPVDVFIFHGCVYCVCLT